MPTLNVYSKFGELQDTKVFSGSLLSYLESLNNFDPFVVPFSATKNGQDWRGYHEDLQDSDIIDLTIEPQQIAPWVYWVITIASTAYSFYQYQKFKDSYQTAREDGKSIYRANAKANQPKPNGIIPERAGRVPIFPDLICPVRRKYINHEEYVYLMTCVTSGYSFVKEKNVYIDQTPITNYAGDYTLNIYEPSESVTTNAAHENWYQSREVSDLKLTTIGEVESGDWALTYSGSTMTSYLNDELTTFPIPLGGDFEITGTNAGKYRVDSVGSPDHTVTVVPLTYDGGSSTLARRGVAAINPTSTRRPGLQQAASQAQSRIARQVSEGSPTTLTDVSPKEQVEITVLNGGVNWEGPYEVIPVSETARYLEIDVSMPAGLVLVDGDGDEQNQTVDIAIEYREVGTSVWNTVAGTSYTDNTFDARGYTVEVDMGSQIRPEVRFRRISKDASDVSVTDDVFIRAVRAKLETPTSYEGITTMALILRGTNAIAGSAENKVNIKGGWRKLPTLAELENAANGTSFDISKSATETSGTHLLTDEVVRSRSSRVDYVGRWSDDGLYYVASYNVALSDGSRLGTIVTYSAATAFDELSLTATGSYSPVGAYDMRAPHYFGGGRFVAVNHNSGKSPSINRAVTVFRLSTNYQIETVTSSRAAVFSFPDHTPTLTQVSEGGTKIWYYESGAIYEVNTNTSTTSSPEMDISVSSSSPIDRFDLSADLASVSPNANVSNFFLGQNVSGLPNRLWVNTDQGTFCYTLSTAGDITTATGLSIVSGINAYHVNENYAYSQVGDEMVTYVLQSTDDSRKTRSLMRFVCNSIYDVIGSAAAEAIDWTRANELESTLDGRGDYLDADFADETTLWEALKIMLIPAFAEPSMKSGKFYPSRTVAGSDYYHVYTPEHMIGDGVIIDDEHDDELEPDGVDVEYVDIDTGELEVVECRLAGDLGLRTKKIKAIGADRTRAWRIGMRVRLEYRYKPANYSFSTEMDALNSEYGDPIGVCSDIFGAQVGRVVSVAGSGITLDFSPTFGAGTYYAAFKKPNGRMSGLYTISQGSPNNVIVITSSPSLDFTPVTDISAGEVTTASIGTSSEWGVRSICKNISPSSDAEVQVVAQEYVPEIFANDDSEPS